MTALKVLASAKGIRPESNRITRLIDAIADGRAAITDIRDRLKAAEDARNEYRHCVADLDDERVVMLHPTNAQNYRQQIELLHEAIGGDDADELRDAVVPRLRVLIDELVVHPFETGRGVAITINGRLAQIIELATGKQVAPAGMLTLERVKGIEPSS